MKIRAMLYLTTALSVAAFANANAQSKLAICAEPQNQDLTLLEFQALTFTDIRFIGNFGETGVTTNMLTYPTWDTVVDQKAKGRTNAGDPDLEVARTPGDPGQAILELAGDPTNNNSYAIRETRNDGTIRYHRGLIAGPRAPGGGNEDFDLSVYTIGMQQAVITVAPSGGGVVGNPPQMTAAPEITGTAEVGETLTLSNGTFTGDAPLTYLYQWFAAGVAISGATNATYVVVAGNVGKKITGRVEAVNAYGAAVGFTDPTADVVA